MLYFDCSMSSFYRDDIDNLCIRGVTKSYTQTFRFLADNTMKIYIYDYANRAKQIEISNIEWISRVELERVTDDEILTIEWKGGVRKRYDSWSGRLNNFYEGSELIYNAIDHEKSVLENWLKNRQTKDRNPIF